MEQIFINGIIKTTEQTFLRSEKLLSINNLNDNVFDVITLLDSYKLPDTNIINLLSHYLSSDDFDISSYEQED